MILNELPRQRELNQAENDLRNKLTSLGQFARRAWAGLLDNVTASQLRFWRQMVVFDPSKKALRTEDDPFYVGIVETIARRLSHH